MRNAITVYRTGNDDETKYTPKHADILGDRDVQISTRDGSEYSLKDGDIFWPEELYHLIDEAVDTDITIVTGEQ